MPNKLKHPNVFRHYKPSIVFFGPHNYLIISEDFDVYEKYIGKRWSGISYESFSGSLWYIDEGYNHRDLGPAGIWDDGRLDYWIHGRFLEPHRYWQEMYKKYKGTDKEELILAELLSNG